MEIKSIEVLGHQMAYRETGIGAPVLFLHGNPTSSYLWRDVMPPVARIARCVAPDLIGMGRSDKLHPKGQGTYSFQTHRRYLDAFVDDVFTKSEPLTLVLHDWGSALGFGWARRHPDRVHGVFYMEAIVCPFRNWGEFGERASGIFQGFRSEEGEKLILDRNMFIERILPRSVLRDLTDEEMIEYRRPFVECEDRGPPSSGLRAFLLPGSPQTWSQLQTIMRHGCPSRRCLNFLSMLSLARSWLARRATFAGVGPTKKRLQWQVATSFKKIRVPKSVRPSQNGWPGSPPSCIACCIAADQVC